MRTPGGRADPWRQPWPSPPSRSTTSAADCRVVHGRRATLDPSEACPCPRQTRRSEPTGDVMAFPATQEPSSTSKVNSEELPTETEAVPSAEIVPFTFNGDALVVVRLPDGDVGVVLLAALRDCRAQPGQPAQAAHQDGRARRSLGNHGRGDRGCGGPGAQGDGRPPPPVHPHVAATLDASRCAPEARPKLVAYQDEAPRGFLTAACAASVMRPRRSPAPPAPPAPPAREPCRVAEVGPFKVEALDGILHHLAVT